MATAGMKLFGGVETKEKRKTLGESMKACLSFEISIFFTYPLSLFGSFFFLFVLFSHYYSCRTGYSFLVSTIYSVIPTC